MSLLLGIDEAGYGPHLGPLVVGGALLEFDEGFEPIADLWGPLRHHLRRKVNGRSKRVVVCDSKDVFIGRPDRDAAVAVLERTVLGFLAACGARPGTLASLMATLHVGPRDPAVAPLPWEAPVALRLPARAAPAEVEAAGEMWSQSLARAGARAAGLRINAAPAIRFNRLVGGEGRNKAAALFALTVELLEHVRGARPREAVFATMDQHGGRRYYEDLLAGAFPMHRVRTVDETGPRRRYEVAGAGGAPLVLEIGPAAETWSLAAALASMTAKYVRELHMYQINGYFCRLLPELAPTAGYGPDGLRFAAEVRPALEADGVPMEAMLRMR